MNFPYHMPHHGKSSFDVKLVFAKIFVKNCISSTLEAMENSFVVYCIRDSDKLNLCIMHETDVSSCCMCRVWKIPQIIHDTAENWVFRFHYFHKYSWNFSPWVSFQNLIHRVFDLRVVALTTLYVYRIELKAINVISH